MIPKSVFTEILLCCHACSVVLMHAKLGTILSFFLNVILNNSQKILFDVIFTEKIPPVRSSMRPLNPKK